MSKYILFTRDNYEGAPWVSTDIPDDEGATTAILEAVKQGLAYQLTIPVQADLGVKIRPVKEEKPPALPAPEPKKEEIGSHDRTSKGDTSKGSSHS